MRYFGCYNNLKASPAFNENVKKRLTFIKKAVVPITLLQECILHKEYVFSVVAIVELS